MSRPIDRRKVIKEAFTKCPIHQIRFPAHLGCPRCKTGNRS